MISLCVSRITFYFVVSIPPSNFLIYLIFFTYLISPFNSFPFLFLNWVEIHISKSNLALLKECSQAYFIEKLSFLFSILLLKALACMRMKLLIHKKEKKKAHKELLWYDNRMWCLISSWCLKLFKWFLFHQLLSLPSMILLDIKLWVINVIGCATYNVWWRLVSCDSANANIWMQSSYLELDAFKFRKIGDLYAVLSKFVVVS